MRKVFEIQPCRDQHTCRPRLTSYYDDYSRPHMLPLNNTLVDIDREGMSSLVFEHSASQGVHRLAVACTCADPCAAKSRRLSAWHCIYYVQSGSKESQARLQPERGVGSELPVERSRSASCALPTTYSTPVSPLFPRSIFGRSGNILTY